jgi:hypothetical protein
MGQPFTASMTPLKDGESSVQGIHGLDQRQQYKHCHGKLT